MTYNEEQKIKNKLNSTLDKLLDEKKFLEKQLVKNAKKIKKIYWGLNNISQIEIKMKNND